MRSKMLWGASWVMTAAMFGMFFTILWEAGGTGRDILGAYRSLRGIEMARASDHACSAIEGAIRAAQMMGDNARVEQLTRDARSARC